MEPKELLAILGRAEKCKCHTRHCYTSSGRKESVAEHSWRMTLMAMLLSGEEEFRKVDMDRVIRMCLIHDLGEAFTGDIPTFEKSDKDTQTEDRLFGDWVEGFAEPQRTEWKGLLEEMGKLESREARTYKALDKLEAVISHNESDISTWLPLEFELQYEYPTEAVSFSPYLRALKSAVDRWTTEKIRAAASRLETTADAGEGADQISGNDDEGE